MKFENGSVRIDFLNETMHIMLQKKTISEIDFKTPRASETTGYVAEMIIKNNFILPSLDTYIQPSVKIYNAISNLINKNIDSSKHDYPFS